MVLPVTPNLLSQVAKRARLPAVAAPMSSRRESCPEAMPCNPSKNNHIYQTTSAPNLVCAPLPAQAEESLEEGNPGSRTDAPTQPQVLHHRGFGSMQDLRHLSRSTSVDSPASMVQPHGLSRPSPLAPAVPLLTSGTPPCHTANPLSTAEPSAEPEVTESPEHSSGEANTPGHEAQAGPEAVSGSAVHVQLSDRGMLTHSDAARDGGNESARALNQLAAVELTDAVSPKLSSMEAAAAVSGASVAPVDIDAPAAPAWPSHPPPAPVPPPKVRSASPLDANAHLRCGTCGMHVDWCS